MTDDEKSKVQLDMLIKNLKEGDVKLYTIFALTKDNVLIALNKATDDAVNKDFYLLYFALKDHLQGLEYTIFESIRESRIKAGDLAH